jgi:hypothetical protein
VAFKLVTYKELPLGPYYLSALKTVILDIMESIMVRLVGWTERDEEGWDKVIPFFCGVCFGVKGMG